MKNDFKRFFNVIIYIIGILILAGLIQKVGLARWGTLLRGVDKLAEEVGHAGHPAAGPGGVVAREVGQHAHEHPVGRRLGGGLGARVERQRLDLH